MPVKILPGLPRAGFLDLPLEMREQIYIQYFTIEGGYIYDAESDKLIQANRCSIDLSLRRVCRTVALETYHYPFTLNTITFSTAYRRAWRKKAAMFDVVTTYHFRLLGAMLERLRHCLTPDMYKTPPTQHDSRLQGWQGIQDDGGDLTRPSGHDNNISSNRAYTYLLKQIANRNPEKFREAINDVLPWWAESKSNPTSDFFELGFDFWAIPSMHEITHTIKELQLEERWDELDLWHYSEYLKEGYTGTRYCYQRKHFFSAAALAIRFLKSMSQTQRLLITKLILNEDRMAVGNPECHIIGLIPFTKENPQLFIEHRVNLWRNIIPRSCEECELRTFPTRNESIIPPPEYELNQHQIYHAHASRTICRFIMHTLESLREGLPPNSYSFIFDGQPDLNHSTGIFRYLTEIQIAWLTAYTDCVAYGVLTPPESNTYPFQTCASTAEILSIQDRSSIVQCNFTLDQPWNYREIAGDDDDNIEGRDSVRNIMRDFDEDDLDFDKLHISNTYQKEKPKSSITEA
ncbi:uncharacterized protein FTJAE_11375 [Fusarium tjaetaba]|uniref:Uncharacterized protein n=1 Tax=Fusarium tjaetaba TaxID=1567544 RepID=A0A8H5VGB3_9HYPO|nr:uncharacterized protein FTJAE_11375 [Fusarium tjaetaba]KAF5621035.1 hypothetical protein FTJAE_11375 [Fusarium tjaetaba]